MKAASIPPATLNELFLSAMERYAKLPAALQFKRDGQWHGISHNELKLRVHRIYAALHQIGVTQGDRVGILSENRPEWAIADYACLMTRCIDVPVYPTLPAQQVAFILADSGCSVVFCSNAEQVDKVMSVREQLPGLKHVIAFDVDVTREGVLSFSALEQEGESLRSQHSEWESLGCQALADDIATLIYTSGTTGQPKGVMLSHGNITSNVLGSLAILDLHPGDYCLSFLPLSHIFERMVGHYTMTYGGVEISYASSIDAVSQEMVEIRPTILASVPRLYEKIYSRVLENSSTGGHLKRQIFQWAREVGDRRLNCILAEKPVPLPLAVQYWIADRLVFRKLRARTGGRLRFFVSGGAPLNVEICRFFLAAGLPILEGYGLTETSPVITVNRLERIKPGTVGEPIPGVEVQIAADGEIVTRGPHIMKGYYQNPVATAEAIDSEGWFHTGDIGVIDADGYLRITDRKKDLIVTAGGKNIAPQPIEAMLKTNKYFSSAVMLGDRRQFPIMLLVPNVDTVNSWSLHHGRPTMTLAEMAADPKVVEKLEREARRSLRDLAQYESPKKFLILPRDFSIESGELTPKMSIRRKVVEKNYATEIDALYA
jgi:long-chain acyl-CoA synthetase